MAVTLTTKITTAAQLAEKAKYVADNCKTLYVYASFGSPLTPANKTYHMNRNSYNRQASVQKKIKASSADTFGFDCVNLIKGLLWGWYGDVNKKHGGAVYLSNGVPDTNADGMFRRCINPSTDFSKIEIGEAVWIPGHIGVYIGNGLVVECTPAWKDKVQVTTVANVEPVPGYNKRKWSKHGKLPYVKYTGKNDPNAVYSKPVTTPSTGNTSSSVKKKRATGTAKSFDKALSGSYKINVSKSLYIRNAAGTDSTALGILPAGQVVKNYGYFTTTGGVRWLLVQTTYKGIEYTGFCSAKYLKKIKA